MFKCGLWASSGPFPLLAHYGLYKRGRDPPTNHSRHLKKERNNLPLKCMLKEDQGRRPTAASAAATDAATTAAPPRADAETTASPCLDRELPACSHFSAAASGRRRRQIVAPPSPIPLHGPLRVPLPPPLSPYPSAAHHQHPGNLRIPLPRFLTFP